MGFRESSGVWSDGFPQRGLDHGRNRGSRSGDRSAVGVPLSSHMPHTTAQNSHGRECAPLRGAVSRTLKSRSGRGGSFGVQRLVMIELAAALAVVGWVISTVALVATRLGRRPPPAARSRTPPGAAPCPSGWAPCSRCAAPAGAGRRHPGAAGHRSRVWRPPWSATRACARTATTAVTTTQRPVGMVGGGLPDRRRSRSSPTPPPCGTERSRRPLPVALVRDALRWTGSASNRRRSCARSQRPRCTCPSGRWR